MKKLFLTALVLLNLGVITTQLYAAWPPVFIAEVCIQTNCETHGTGCFIYVAP